MESDHPDEFSSVQGKGCKRVRISRNRTYLINI